MEQLIKDLYGSNLIKIILFVETMRKCIFILFLMLVSACERRIDIGQLPGKYAYYLRGYPDSSQLIDSIYIMEDFKYEHVCYMGNNVFRQTGVWRASPRVTYITFRGYTFYDGTERGGGMTGPWAPTVRKVRNEIRLYYSEGEYYKKELPKRR